jgi:hypothetical protein
MAARERARRVRRQPVPEPCVAVAAARDTVIDSLLVTIDGLQAAAALQGEAIARLSGALADTRAAADTLRAILAAAPSPRPAWVPAIGVGPFVGLCADGRPCAGLGVSLQWKVRLPWR